VYDWMKLTVSETAYAAGEWDTSEEYLIGGGPRLLGVTRIFAHEREAELALGTGDEARAQAALDAAEPLVQVSAEPQWIGMHGVLRGELCRRQRHLEGAQRAVQDALDRLEVCTDDVMRIARVSVVGARVEADRAQRARDLRDTAQRRDALARARIHVERLDAAAAEGGPVERAYLAEARAELARARDKGAAREWALTATAWDEVQRPYPAATARWRQAEALAAGGNRTEAARVADEALRAARRLGSHWLVDELTTLGDRARLGLGRASAGQLAADGNGALGVDGGRDAESDPFGLTPRERQVLGLLAQGATNRQIGAALFMAEKTASVHVSRILAKLDVQGRTEAAAVAHRLHLA
jgi:DNA-binding CsgD family transcriptional regulator